MILVCWLFNLIALAGYGGGIVYVIVDAIQNGFSILTLLVTFAILSLVDYIILSIVSYLTVGESIYAGIIDLDNGCLGALIFIVMSIITSPIMVIVMLFFHLKITLEVMDEY